MPGEKNEVSWLLNPDGRQLASWSTMRMFRSWGRYTPEHSGGGVKVVVKGTVGNEVMVNGFHVLDMVSVSVFSRPKEP